MVLVFFDMPEAASWPDSPDTLLPRNKKHTSVRRAPISGPGLDPSSQQNYSFFPIPVLQKIL